MRKKQDTKNSVVIYVPKKGGAEVHVRIEQETVRLSLDQIAEVFGRDKSVISRHIRNIFATKELDKKSVVAKNATTAADGKTYMVDYYNLDLILSVGYRVNSRQATAFRMWATSVLKKYLLEGYAINARRLEHAQKQFKELQETVHFLSGKISRETLKGKERDVFALLSEYAKTLSVLEQYDKATLKSPKGKRANVPLSYEEARGVLESVRAELIQKNEASELFARERGGEFQGIIRGLYQTFGGKALYPSVEDKAAHLLYFIIKDHPFSDGNKRSASFLFVYFLDLHNHLHKKNGEKKINDNALAALALLVAESDPKEKETMVRLVENLIT